MADADRADPRGSTNCWTPAASTTSGPTACRCRVRADRARRDRGHRAARAGRARGARSGAARAGPPRAVLELRRRSGCRRCWPSGCGCCSSHDIALAAYHLPLDAHPEVGNNALLAEALGAGGHVAFAGIGRGATFAEPRARGRAVRARGRGDRARAARVRRRATRCAPARDRLRRRREPARPSRSRRATTRSSPASRSENVDGRRARGRDPLHRRRATTRPRPSACAVWAICWPTASASPTSGWTSRIRFDACERNV